MKRLLPIALITSLLLGFSSAAFAAWLATGTGTATAAAGSLGAGATPTAAITSRTPTAPTAAVRVDWSAAADASGYTVQRAPSGTETPVTISSDCNAAPVAGLTCTEAATPEGIWRYRVVPQRGAWTGTAGAWSAEVPVVPAQPTALQASTVSASQIDLTWTDNSQLAGRTFILESGPSSSGPWTTLSPAPTGASYSHTGLTCGTTYHYQVRVEGQGLQSPASPAVSATTPPCASGSRVATLGGTVVTSGNTWTATVTITVDDGTSTVSGATVSGRWSDYRGAPTPATTVTCVTGPGGTCPITLSGIPNGDPDTARFTVTGVSAPYAGPSANTHNLIDFARSGNSGTATPSK